MPISLNGSTGITVNGITLIGASTTDTLTNKTLVAAVLSGTATGTYTLAGTPTITAPVLSGTATGTYTLAGTPTITAPVLSGTATGTYTLAGTPTFESATTTGSIRGTVTTDNDGSFNMNVTNNFKCTPTGAFALTFTNITAGQSGYILLVNTNGVAVTAAATTKVGATFLSAVSTAGTYLISYLSDGTNVYCTASGALS